MDRRSFAKSVGAFGCTYFWIPKIAIAQDRGSIHEVSLRTTKVLADNFQLISRGNIQLAENHTQYKSTIAGEKTKLAAFKYNNWSSEESTYSESSSYARSSFATRHVNDIDRVNSYFHYRDSEYKAVAHVPTLPFFKHGSIVAKAAKSFSQNDVIAYLYPRMYVQYFDIYLGEDIPIARPIRLLCDSGVWVLSCKAHSQFAGVGRHTLYKRDMSTVIYDENFDYEFA